MQLRYWQVTHIAGIWNPTAILKDSLFPEAISEIPVDDSKQGFWVPDGFAPPGWEDTRFKTVLAIMLNDPHLFGDKQYSFPLEQSMKNLAEVFPNNAVLAWDDYGDTKVLKLVSPEVGEAMEEEKEAKGIL